VEPQPLVRRQAALPRFGIVEIHLRAEEGSRDAAAARTAEASCGLPQQLQYITTFIGEALRHIHELSTSVRKAVGQQDC
jgi:hypothetical protein